MSYIEPKLIMGEVFENSSKEKKKFLFLIASIKISLGKILMFVKTAEVWAATHCLWEVVGLTPFRLCGHASGV